MVYYLDPEFDPKKLTKAELRSIMASHGILDLPPPSAKKDELLDMFCKEIVAKRKSIIESQNNVKAKSDGIVFLDESSRPSPKRPKKSSKNYKESISDTEFIPSPSKMDPNERPSTPVNISTYRLVSRLENLQGKYSDLKGNVEKNNQSVYLIISWTIAAILITSYLYFKFFFVWPVYTEEQLISLKSKPIFYLRCPYSSSSSIGSCSDGKLYCASGYIESRSWIGFGSSCLVDKERMSLIQSIKKKIVFELRTSLGLFECNNQSSILISKSELHGFIYKYFKNIKAKTFSDYYDICLRTLMQEGTEVEFQLQ